MVDWVWKVVEEVIGVDFFCVFDVELVDGWYYNVFLNFMYWGGYGLNMWYCFCLYEDSYEWILMEVGYLMCYFEDVLKLVLVVYI